MTIVVKFGGDPIAKSPFTVGVAAPLDLSKVSLDNLDGSKKMGKNTFNSISELKKHYRWQRRWEKNLWLVRTPSFISCFHCTPLPDLRSLCRVSAILDIWVWQQHLDQLQWTVYNSINIILIFDRGYFRLMCLRHLLASWSWLCKYFDKLHLFFKLSCQ